MTEETNKQSGPNETERNAGENDKITQQTPRMILIFIYITFCWGMMGVPLIYGIRRIFDIPIHPSFIPIVGAVFAAVLALTIVISIHQVVGTIKIETTGAFKFEGATGQIIFWCICFLVIVYGLYLLGLSDVTKAEYKQDSRISCSINDLLFRDKCHDYSINQKAP